MPLFVTTGTTTFLFYFLETQSHWVALSGLKLTLLFLLQSPKGFLHLFILRCCYLAGTSLVKTFFKGMKTVSGLCRSFRGDGSHCPGSRQPCPEMLALWRFILLVFHVPPSSTFPFPPLWFINMIKSCVLVTFLLLG